MADAPTDAIPLSATHYARAIERRWAERLEEPLLLSPRDWRRIEGWYAERVPLAVIEEAMSAALARARARGRSPRLADLAGAVAEAWELIRSGRLTEATTAIARVHRPSSIERWRARAAIEPGAPIARLLLELLERADAGDDADELDRRLDRRLVDCLDADSRSAVESEVQRELAPFRDRMTAERFEATRREATVARARRRLNLPSLAGEATGD